MCVYSYVLYRTPQSTVQQLRPSMDGDSVHQPVQHVELCAPWTACSTNVLAAGQLVACYLVVLLMANHSTSSCVLAWMVHLRCAAPLGHLYLGLGMHSALRTALGCIEAMSCAFRSMSLGLRTACNAIAGHVLLAVLVDMTCSATDSECLVLVDGRGCASARTSATRVPTI